MTAAARLAGQVAPCPARGSARRRSRVRPRSPGAASRRTSSTAARPARRSTASSTASADGHHRDDHPQDEQHRTQASQSSCAIAVAAKSECSAHRLESAHVRRCSKARQRPPGRRAPRRRASGGDISTQLRLAQCAPRGRCAPGAARSRRPAPPAGRAACRADHRHGAEVDAVAQADLPHQARQRLAAVAVLLRACAGRRTPRRCARPLAISSCIMCSVHGVDATPCRSCRGRCPTGWWRPPRASRHG